MAGYLFDWTRTPPETDDPAWAGRLRAGTHNTVVLNGEDMGGHVLRFRTGPDGWVERHKLNEDGHPYCETYVLETGEVPDPQPTWQVKVPQPDGTWKNKYGERIATEVLRGNVEYVNTEHPAAVTA